MDSESVPMSEAAPAAAVVRGPEPAGDRRSAEERSAAPRHRVLLISYAFPPTGGGGVQRAVKFVKYLPGFGWYPTVLTVANPSVPTRDSDLTRDLSPDTRIVRARTWEPGYGVKKQFAETANAGRNGLRSWVRRRVVPLLQPDPQILWNPRARRAAAQVLREEPHQAIFVTGPPFSSFLLGRKLKKQFGLPLVLDFRDEWMLVSRHLENYRLRGLACRRNHRMMQQVLRAADAVVATTRASAEELARSCRLAGSRASVFSIYNGFDPDDLSGLGTSQDKTSALKIVYTGTLWELTDISPLVRALQSVATTVPDRAGDIELIIAGRRTAQQDAVLERISGTGVRLDCRDYQPHNRSLALAAGADLLLLLLADQPGAERVVPAKVFEYMALGKPVLAIAPEGEVRRLLTRRGGSAVFAPQDVERISRFLISWLTSHSALRAPRAERSRPIARDPYLSCFSRPKLAGELATVLRQCVAACRG